MPNRSWSTEALVLSLSSFGEGHREALLLTRENGLIRAAVFGGAKSKLRAMVSPYQSGTIWLYSDPVKKSTKVTDFDVVSWRTGIRENLVRAWCAALCSEIVTRSHGVSDWRLVNAFLDGISVSDEDGCRRGTLRFIWRLLHLAGINPDFGTCARCGNVALTDFDAENRPDAMNRPADPLTAGDGYRPDGSCAKGVNDGKKSENEVVYYSPYEDACVCARCAQTGERRFPLSRTATAYLLAIEKLSPQEVRRFPLDIAVYAELRNFLFFLVSRMIDGTLKTLEAGEGIL